METCVWSDEETRKLISLWSDDAVQAQLMGSTTSSRNRAIYDKLSRDMESAGYRKTGELCRRKLNTLKSLYRKLKEKHSLNGQEGDVRWRYWEAIHAVMMKEIKPVIQQPTGTHAESIGNELEEEERVKECAECVTNENNVIGCHSVTIPNPNPTASRSDATVSVNMITGTRRMVTKNHEIQVDGKNRKRRRVLDTKEDRMEVLLEKMIKLQEESERHHIRLEEKLLSVMEQMRQDSHEMQLRIIALLPSQPVATDELPPADVHHGTYIFTREDNQ